MNNDDQKPPAPAEVTIVPAETPVEATDILAPIHSSPPALTRPETLVQGLRYLRQRIPGFTQLSVREKRSRVRAANLDPEFIQHGLQAASAWSHTKLYVRRSGEELQQEQEEIREWDQAIIEMRALTDGMEAANLKRKHHLGSAILMIYGILGRFLNKGVPTDEYMRPYYENMRRAYLRTQNFSKKKKEKK